MPKVIRVRFQKAGRIYDFDLSGFEDLKYGDAIIVETNRGRELDGSLQSRGRSLRERSRRL